MTFAAGPHDRLQNRVAFPMPMLAPSIGVVNTHLKGGTFATFAEAAGAPYYKVPSPVPQIAFSLYKTHPIEFKTETEREHQTKQSIPSETWPGTQNCAPDLSLDAKALQLTTLRRELLTPKEGHTSQLQKPRL